MKKIIEEYYCDICGKKVDAHINLDKFHIPSRNYNSDGSSWHIGESEVEMCKECKEHYFTVTQNHFAEVINQYDKVELVNYRKGEK